MRFQKFTIDNYRAIEHAELAVSKSLIPIIGVNESGKTSILQALLAFDRVSDSYGGGGHLEYKNKYILRDHSCRITADILLESENDLIALSSKLRLGLDSPVLGALRAMRDDGKPISLTRTLPSLDYSVSGIEVDEGMNTRLSSALYRLLPFILYFDDFTDRVPDRIEFRRSHNQRGYKLVRSRRYEWQRVLEEVFRRGTDGEYTLQSFININDSDQQGGLLSDIRDVLNKEIMEDWRELKKWGGHLADDPADLELALNYSTEGERDFGFEFKVHDRSRTKTRIFKVTDRSKGFQWYFNFLMKLKFNPKYKRDHTGAIYLLDEPGSYLHSSAQLELLKALQDISDTNTIVYCTHSQHLLDPDHINLAHIRIAEKAEGRINVIPFGSAPVTKYQGALTPLITALQMKGGTFNRDVKRAIITEGVLDFYFFKLLLDHTPGFRVAGVDIIPGAGANQLKELISFCLAWTEDYLVLLDSDKTGRDARDKYAQWFGPDVSGRLECYRTPERSYGVRLESLFSDADRKRLLEKTESQNVKTALATIFYGPEEAKVEMFGNLDDDTIGNLSVLRERLMALAQ